MVKHMRAFDNVREELAVSALFILFYRKWPPTSLELNIALLFFHFYRNSLTFLLFQPTDHSVSFQIFIVFVSHRRCLQRLVSIVFFQLQFSPCTNSPRIFCGLASCAFSFFRSLFNYHFKIYWFFVRFFGNNRCDRFVVKWTMENT